MRSLPRGASGIEVFLDQSELRGGDAWDQKIQREIQVRAFRRSKPILLAIVAVAVFYCGVAAFARDSVRMPRRA
jgi:hypothetical protein